MKAKMTFEVDKNDALILASADEFYVSLWEIQELALREKEKMNILKNKY